MITYVVWMEMDHARLFRIAIEGKTTRLLRRHEVKHHTSRDPENHKDSEKFFHEVAAELKDAGEILLTGPGLAKDHFKAHLVRHHHEGLAAKIIGTRTLKLMSDERLLHHARAFFKTYNLFGQNVPA